MTITLGLPPVRPSAAAELSTSSAAPAISPVTAAELGAALPVSIRYLINNKHTSVQGLAQCACHFAQGVCACVLTLRTQLPAALALRQLSSAVLLPSSCPCSTVVQDACADHL
jgi:hypothetical protein